MSTCLVLLVLSAFTVIQLHAQTPPMPPPGNPCNADIPCPVMQICVVPPGSPLGQCQLNPAFTTVAVETTTPLGSRCEFPWSTYETSRWCYLAQYGSHNFVTAAQSCEQMGGVLANPMTAVENLFVNGIYTNGSSTNGPYWIGLRKLNGAWGWPTWISTGPNSGFPMIAPLTFTNWRPSQPDNCCGGDVTCAVANYLNLNGEWDDAGCGETFTNPLGMVCQKPIR